MTPYAKEAVEMPDTIDRTRTAAEPHARVASEELARGQAIKQVERRRRFRIQIALSSLGMFVLVTIWAIAEYQNAGG